jgi:hypothetical protein
MLEGLSNLLAGNFKGTGLYLGILLAGLGAIIIFTTVYWDKKKGKK